MKKADFLTMRLISKLRVITGVLKFRISTVNELKTTVKPVLCDFIKLDMFLALTDRWLLISA